MEGSAEKHDPERRERGRPYTKQFIANLSEFLAEEMKVTHYEEIASIKR
jgi:hypothetical protein